MKDLKDLMKKAHEITKRIIKIGDNYRATLSLVLKYVHSLRKNKMNRIVLKGTEKQVKYANDLLDKVIASVNEMNKNLDLIIEHKKSDLNKLEGDKLTRRITYINNTLNLKENINEGLNYILSNIDNTSYLIDRLATKNSVNWCIDFVIEMQMNRNKKLGYEMYLDEVKKFYKRTKIISRLGVEL